MKIFLFVLITLTILSCKTSKEHSVIIKNYDTLYSLTNLSDSLTIIISSTNLSEDVSTLSSNDDEISIFIYPYNDSSISTPPLISNQFIFKKNKMSETIYYKGIKNLINKDLILFLIEIDSEKKNEEIDLLIRKSYIELQKGYAAKNYLEIEKQIGDDDILGIKVLPNFKSPTTIDFSDIYRMDKYNYEVILK
ncbi:MAG: hypothetical protein NTX97_00815 [Bacteroidetes bacterium]|nr:hypothetical protein [Bacteroidota bacterium]